MNINDTSQLAVQRAVDDELMLIGQMSNPLSRAKRAGELIQYLLNRTNQVAEMRRRAVAEALEWPGTSMEHVTSELGLSRSAVTKLAPPDLRAQMAENLRQRLANGLNLPPQRPAAARLARKGLNPPAT